MEYNFREIERRWQQHWNDVKAYQVSNNSSKPKYYVLDMFPYPSGAGLHVGHPLGYIASDIYSRYKRLKGYNVLHPMGYDAFGLPAEQYAIEHGVHPADSTAQNIANFRRQLDNIGFSYDWSREVKTSDPGYYKWTQWIFLQLFGSWYNRKTDKAESIGGLIHLFETEGNTNTPCPRDSTVLFTADEWNSYEEKEQQDILMQYRLAYCGEGEVNWCEVLGTVLANDEVINGVSERGGYPVVKKKLRQWYLRITEYASRLQGDLDKLEWTDAMKEMQTNWIGKSYGAEIEFKAPSISPNGGGNQEDIHERIPEKDEQKLKNHGSAPPPLGEAGWGPSVLTVYTTRPDTIFGVDFMVVAPEHELVSQITTNDQKAAVDEYIAYVNSRSERERQAEKKITGCFTGAYAINPFNEREIPIWISEYVLAGYGTGAIMAVPCGDDRDFKFAQHFNIPITNIIGDAFNGEEANPTKDAILSNSGFLDGMPMRQAMEKVLEELEKRGIGRRKTNYRMRDAAFSRQRYWGEPFPIIWKDGIAYPLPESSLPLELPHMENIKPGKEGEGPLANNLEWSQIALTPGPSPQVERGDVESSFIPDPSSQVEKGAVGAALIPNPSPQVEKGAVGAANVPKYDIADNVLYESAKKMRKEYTKAEDDLWQLLRNSQLGVKFRRQHPIDRYIVDFVALQNKLIVEVDGGYHDDPAQQHYDTVRAKALNDIGFEVIRFTNEEVNKDPYAVKKKINTVLQNKTSGNQQNNTVPNSLDVSTEAPLSTRGEGQGVRAIRETNTMPGYAGSSWYFLRYMDPHNTETFADRKVTDYWNQVDVYIGGTEHAVGHLLYSRMWTKALYDLGHIGFDEPFKKLVNQGMIQGSSRFVYRLRYAYNPNIYYTLAVSILESCSNHMPLPQPSTSDVDVFFQLRLNNGCLIALSPDEIIFKALVEGEEKLIEWLKEITNAGTDYKSEKEYPPIFFSRDKLPLDLYRTDISVHDFDSIRVPVDCVDGYELDIDKLREKRPLEYANAEFFVEDRSGNVVRYVKDDAGKKSGKYICTGEVEKMSKSKLNTENPDELVIKYGSDTFRMYEMFLGPIEQSKPWDTKGIEGVHRFLKKLWRLFFDDNAPLSERRGAGGEAAIWNDETPTAAELKILHRTIKKIEDDTERFSFNTAVSAFMVCVNELTDSKCHKKAILEPLLIMLMPYAPHIAEELYQQLQVGNVTVLSPSVGGVGEAFQSVLNATFPAFEEKYVLESTKEYPVSINGKLRTTLTFPLDAEQSFIEKEVMANEIVLKWTEGKQPKKIIYVKGRMINVVV